MATHEVQLHDLLGRRVRDSGGTSIGRIEEVRGEREANECYAVEFLVGEYGLFERLAGGPLRRSVLRALPGAYRGFRVPWHQLDLSDPRHPRTTVPKAALAPSEESAGGAGTGREPPEGGEPAPRRGRPGR